MHCFETCFSSQVWPDFPDVVINSSLDWDSQVEVRGLCGCGGSGMPGRCHHA